MKIRLHQQEVRIRLGLTEVAALCDGRQVHTQLKLGLEPSQLLSFMLRPDEVVVMDATYIGGTLLVRVPKELLQGWLEDGREGFEQVQYFDRETALTILVQKDYSCTHHDEHRQNTNRTDPPADTFEWSRVETAMPYASSVAKSSKQKKNEES